MSPLSIGKCGCIVKRQIIFSGPQKKYSCAVEGLMGQFVTFKHVPRVYSKSMSVLLRDDGTVCVPSSIFPVSTGELMSTEELLYY